MSKALRFAHGNSKNQSKGICRNAPSVITGKEQVKGKALIVAFAESLNCGPRDIKREMVDSLRYVTQGRNAFKTVRAA